MLKILKEIWNKNFKGSFKRGFVENSDITEEEFEKYKKNGAIIVDVRSPQEYKEGHIDGAICIPEYEIEKTAEKILKNKNDIIVVYCSTGHRSKKAQAELEKMGYNNVLNVYGGINI